MTYSRDDSKVIKDYLEEIKKRFIGKEIEDIRKDIVEKFKEEDIPKILIVTDMLLTGFDAPMLQTMYLDKPLKEHRLLQAIARTNRPYKDVKEAGVIIDYVGILTEFKRAFELYSKEEIKGALYDVNDIRQEFNTLLNNLLSLFESIPKDDYSREILLKAIEILTSEEEKSKEFLEQYKQLRKIFELLGPDEIKVERFSEYKWLSAIYTYYIRTVLRSQPSYEGYVQKYFNKTVKFVHESTELYNMQKDLPSIHFDEQYLKTLEDKVKSREEKAANIVFTLNRLVLVDRHQNPVYETITEKVDRILKLWKEKTKDFEKIYTEGAEIIKEIEKLSQRQRELGFSNLQYSLLLLLEKRFGDKPSLINDVKELSQILQPYTFSGWTYQSTARKKVEGDVRRFVRKYVKEYDMNIEEMDALYQQLIANVMNYGKAG
jgi:type I restriction enzyme R subunit